MKFCKDCHWMKKEAMVLEGHGKVVTVCTHEECRHPVTGEPIPAQAARQETIFCSFQAKYWTKKEENAPKGNLVQI
jgi:hypothetical protein